MLHMPTPMLMAQTPAPVGQVSFGAATNWTVPAGVFSISLVGIGQGGARYWTGTVLRCGGGGGLSYRNAFAVMPGEILQIDINNAHTRVLRTSSVIIQAGAGQDGSQETIGLGGAADTTVGTVSHRGGNGVDLFNGDGQAWSEGGNAGRYTHAGSEHGLQGLGTSLTGIINNNDGAGFYGFGGGTRPDGTTIFPGPGGVRIMWGDSRSFPSNAGDV